MPVQTLPVQRLLQRLPRPRGIRAKITAGVAGVIALSLVLASVGLLWALERNLNQQADDAISTQANDRAALLESGADPSSLVFTRARESFVRIESESGTVIASGGLELVHIEAVEAGIVTTASASYVEHDGKLESEDVRVAARSVTTPDGSVLLLLVGAEHHTSSSTLSTTRSSLYIAIPLLVVASAAAAWVGVGRTLRPVESIRRDAARITGDQMHQRVPVTGAGDEIDDLAVTVNDMLDRLAEHDSKTRQFSADASHELKTPVANIKALLEVSDADGWETARDAAINESDRLVHIVDDLLFVTAGAAKTAAEPTTVHLDDIVFDEAELLRTRHDIRIDVGRVSPADVQGEPLALRRAVRNLLDNAGRHASSTITVSLSSHAEAIELVIADDGDGIADEDRRRIFERFVRLDEARARSAGGTGLGLSIVHQIVDGHRGSISVGASESGGAAFKVTLPPS